MNSTILKPKTGLKTFSDPEFFISRELSWLDFNDRVLDEARFPVNPLLERLKFIAIFSSNLDEFFMVRVAGLRQLIHARVNECDPAGNTPVQQLLHARKKISAMLKKQYSLLDKYIIPQLAAAGIFIRRLQELTPDMQVQMKSFFKRNIMPALTPLAVDPSHPFPLLNSGAVELAVKLYFPKSRKSLTAFVEVPELFDRFIRLPENSAEEISFILLEDLIAENAGELFPGGEIRAMQIFRVTRDMDYSIDDDDSEDLLHALQNKLRQRRSRAPVRLEFSSVRSNKALQNYLADSLELEPEFCYHLPGPLHLKQYAGLINQLDRPELLEPVWQPQMPEVFSGYSTVFEAISARKNILLTHPYQSFDPLVRLLEEAAGDPSVVAIKQTLYRVSGNSPIVKALRRAAENGKQVTVLVELKARFDESNNIAWAELLDLSGAHVAYGMPGLKVHCKALLIVRRENGILRSYVHFGTGNYNDRTAELYTDFSLLSCDPELTADAAVLFNLLSGSTEPPDKWSAISSAPFDLRRKLTALIRRETALGTNGRIIAKMNSLSDPELITLIHQAAAAGVKIDLIVRGICCCRIQGNEKNLRIISIIDRFLEHSRVFYFGNNGNDELYCSSADWMPRNLDRRVELMFPIYDREIKKEIMTILDFHLHDRDKQRKLLASGCYSRPAGKNPLQTRSQWKIYEFLQKNRQKTE